MIITKPDYGWVSIWFDNVIDLHNTDTITFIGSCSYLNDVMFDLIEGMIKFYTNPEPTMIRFDEEGSNWTLIITYDKVFIISERYTTEMYETKETPKSVTKAIVRNCLEFINDWADWEVDNSPKEIERNKKYYLDRIKVLGGLAKLEFTTESQSNE